MKKTFPSEFEVVITQKDVKNLSLEDFSDNEDCALARAVKKALKIPKVRVGYYIIEVSPSLSYYLNNSFYKSTFENLKSGGITEFRTIAKKSWE